MASAASPRSRFATRTSGLFCRVALWETSDASDDWLALFLGSWGPASHCVVAALLMAGIPDGSWDRGRAGRLQTSRRSVVVAAAGDIDVEDVEDARCVVEGNVNPH